MIRIMKIFNLRKLKLNYNRIIEKNYFEILKYILICIHKNLKFYNNSN